VKEEFLLLTVYLEVKKVKKELIYLKDNLIPKSLMLVVKILSLLKLETLLLFILLVVEGMALNLIEKKTFLLTNKIILIHNKNNFCHSEVKMILKAIKKVFE
jgi:hypothetical protein